MGIGLSASNQNKQMGNEIQKTEKKEQVVKFEGNKSSEPYYSWFGNIISKARKGCEKFIVTNPRGSALVVSLVEGGLVGFYLYKLKPGEKVSSKKAIIASLLTALSCFNNKLQGDAQRALSDGSAVLSDVSPVLKEQAASLPLEIAVRSAALLWQLLSEVWALSLHAQEMQHLIETGVITDAWGRSMLNWRFGKTNCDVMGSIYTKGLKQSIKDIAKDISIKNMANYAVVPIVLNWATVSTSIVTHELGHGIVNRMITGEPFGICFGEPYEIVDGMPSKKEVSWSKTILGVSLTNYPSSPSMPNNTYCTYNKVASSKIGRTMTLACGPLGGITGALAICGARSLITKKSFVSQFDSDTQRCIILNLDNLLNPFLGSIMIPSDGAKIFKTLGINP